MIIGGGFMENKILELAEKHKIKIKENSIKIDNSGLDFQVGFCSDSNNREWVFRIPRRDDVFPRTKVEKQALDIVNSEKFSFQAPDYKIYSEQLIAYPKLDGFPVGTICPEKKMYIWAVDINNLPDNFFNTLGKALFELHNIDLIKLNGTDIKIQTPLQVRADMKARMEKVKHEFGVGEKLWERWNKWLEYDSYWPEKSGFIHGELHAGHILIDSSVNITGFIDWTEVKYSDLAGDFSVFNKIFGDKNLDKLIKAYQNNGGYIYKNFKNHIIEYIAAYPVGVAEYAMISGMDFIVEMAKKELQVI